MGDDNGKQQNKRRKNKDRERKREKEMVMVMSRIEFMMWKNGDEKM
jgi:hypothetical protein